MIAVHARSMRFTARPGAADELASLLVRVADSLRSTPGCVMWLVARNPDAESEVWVLEQWESAAAADQALAAEGDGDAPRPEDVLALCAGMPQRTDLTLVGGIGFKPAH